jgi:dynein intermediate chain 1
LETYEGHNLAVYSVKWNPWHPRVFLSASADWTVKLWDHNYNTAMMSFDLGLAVADVAWAPYSSTVFAAATADLTCRVYDLNIDKHGELCKSKILRRGRLTKVEFNPSQPIVIVGDEKGGINCYKLSPNLRKMPPPPGEDEEVKKPEDVEIEKMETLLASIDRTVY